MKETNDTAVNLIICSCISADSNLDNNDRKQNIKMLKDLLKNKKAVGMSREQAHIAREGIRILKKEIRDDRSNQR